MHRGISFKFTLGTNLDRLEGMRIGEGRASVPIDIKVTQQDVCMLTVVEDVEYKFD